MKPRLEEWYYAYGSLFGKVYNHPKLADGLSVQTSEVLDLNLEANTAKTRNTEYDLGVPAAKFINFKEETDNDN